MLIKISVMFIVINLIFEVFETVFPMSRMNGFVKSFVGVVFLYVVCLKLFEIL